jgi:peptide/nickel transport system permease protein
MLAYFVRRLVQAIPVLLGISLIIFVLIYYLPADPARIYAGPSATVETVARIRQELGLDDPLWVQYTRYLGRMMQGDLGFSYRKQMAVSALILDRLPYTASLVLSSILVELLIGLPVGIVSALARGRWPDRMGMMVALLGVSMPSFWLGLLLLYWFGYLLPIFPLGGAGGSPWSLLHLVLPALTAGLGGAAWYARMMRSSMLEVLSQDFVRTAHAKGLHRAQVLTRHVLSNSLNPIITMAGMDIPWFIGGVVLVERIFNWPGVGRLAVEAIETVDVPLILGTVIFTACVVVLSGILIDLVQGLFDPRIRHETS